MLRGVSMLVRVVVPLKNVIRLGLCKNKDWYVRVDGIWFFESEDEAVVFSKKFSE